MGLEQVQADPTNVCLKTGAFVYDESRDEYFVCDIYAIGEGCLLRFTGRLFGADGDYGSQVTHIIAPGARLDRMWDQGWYFFPLRYLWEFA